MMFQCHQEATDCCSHIPKSEAFKICDLVTVSLPLQKHRLHSITRISPAHCPYQNSGPLLYSVALPVPFGNDTMALGYALFAMPYWIHWHHALAMHCLSSCPKWISFSFFCSPAAMRLTISLLRRASSSKYFQRYIQRVLSEDEPVARWNPLSGWHRPQKEIWIYDKYRPWTDDFKLHSRQMAKGRAKPRRPLVEPIEEWDMFKGDVVSHFYGKSVWR